MVEFVFGKIPYGSVCIWYGTLRLGLYLIMSPMVRFVFDNEPLVSIPMVDFILKNVQNKISS